MLKSVDTNRKIEITQNAFDKIMSWSQATTEIVFVCAGLGNTITEVVRIKNISNEPKDYFEYSMREYRMAKKEIVGLGLELICTGHSHSRREHLNYPSKLDYRYLPKNTIQMISKGKSLSAWYFSKSYKETILNKVLVNLENN